MWRIPSTHHFHWFKQWIIEGYSVRQLSNISKLSQPTLNRSIWYWLQHPPAWRCSLQSVHHLICDGTFLEQRIGIYAIMNADTRQLIFAAYDQPEGGGRLLPVYQALASGGLSPDSVTVDGNPQQIKYLHVVWPSITLQRCLVHVQRQGLSWCRQNPKRTDAKHLREIFRRLSTVKTSSQADHFLQSVRAWEQRFGAAIDHSTDRGWVFSDLVRARRMLLKALPDLFHFVTNSHIPSSTNALEGYFSHLKEHYRYHCGLAVHHRDAYFKWFFYLMSIKKSNTK